MVAWRQDPAIAGGNKRGLRAEELAENTEQGKDRENDQEAFTSTQKKNRPQNKDNQSYKIITVITGKYCSATAEEFSLRRQAAQPGVLAFKNALQTNSSSLCILKNAAFTWD